MAVRLADEGIDHKAKQYQKMLANLQGNILKGHGRGHSLHMFLKFKELPSDKVRTWIQTFAKRYVTSAEQQLRETDEFNNYHIPGRLFGNFFLSAKGYEVLGFAKLPEELGEIKFRDGMQAHSQGLNDPDAQTWEKAYQDQQIHAMILLADNDRDYLLREARALLDDVQTVADVLTVEHGFVLRNHDGQTIEHFGYVDGRSQPLFLQTDIVDEKDNKGGIDRWPPSAPLGLVLVPDFNVRNEEDCFGSYLVFRKLEQNVRGFKQCEGALANALGLMGDDRERAGALVVGRFEDGTPVALSPAEGMNTPVPNNFTYENDQQGLKCPFQAHIRKVNPRGDTVGVCGNSAEREREHRIVRRGITYGKRDVEPKDDPRPDQLPTDGVGLLFMCYQGSIDNQFGFIQRQYANSPDFVHKDIGVDPVIGQDAANATPVAPQWPRVWGKHGTQRFGFEGFVTLKGGEFFFAPSIPFLRGL